MEADNFSVATVRLCRAAGLLSCLPYIAHYKLVYLYMNWIASGGGWSGVTALVATGLFAFTVVCAVAAYRPWGRPLRVAVSRT